MKRDWNSAVYMCSGPLGGRRGDHAGRPVAAGPESHRMDVVIALLYCQTQTLYQIKTELRSQ